MVVVLVVRIEYDDYFEVVRVLGWCNNNEHRVWIPASRLCATHRGVGDW